MVLGYMVFWATFRLFGNFGKHFTYIKFWIYGHFGYMVNFTRTKPWTIYRKPGVYGTECTSFSHISSVWEMSIQTFQTPAIFQVKIQPKIVLLNRLPGLLLEE